MADGSFYPMISRHYEHPFNWRMARDSRRSAVFNLMSDGPALSTTGDRDDLYVFVPWDHTCNILALRNWLHDGENIAAGYRMVGCFHTDSRLKTVLSGLKFVFAQAVDAIYFRIYLSAQ